MKFQFKNEILKIFLGKLWKKGDFVLMFYDYLFFILDLYLIRKRIKKMYMV